MKRVRDVFAIMLAELTLHDLGFTYENFGLKELT